jgi:hypothetical protein
MAGEFPSIRIPNSRTNRPRSHHDHAARRRQIRGKVYDTSGGLHGVGASVVNALSEWMEIEVFRERRAYKQRFERGHAVRS